MRDGDWVAGLVGVAIFGGVAVVVWLIESSIRHFWRWIRTPRNDQLEP